jgi:hypothetical protein
VKWTCLVTLAFLSLTISGHEVHQGAHLIRQSTPNNKPDHPKAEATSTAKPQIQRARNPLDRRVTPLESQIPGVRAVHAMISQLFYVHIGHDLCRFSTSADLKSGTRTDGQPTGVLQLVSRSIAVFGRLVKPI